jgi:hypothetical protein
MCLGNLLEVGIKTKITTMNLCVLHKPQNGMMKAKTIQTRKTPSHTPSLKLKKSLSILAMVFTYKKPWT